MKGSCSMLLIGRHVLLALLASGFAARAAAQGTLLAGQTLPQVGGTHVAQSAVILLCPDAT